MSDRIPPHSEKAERAVLGSCLIDAEAYWQVADWLEPEDFYDTTCRIIFAAFQRVANNGHEIDIVSVSDDLQERNLLSRIGGQSQLTSFISQVPTSVHVEHYADTVRSHAVRRRLIHAVQELAVIAHDPNQEDPVAACEERLAHLDGAGRAGGIIRGSKLLGRYVDNYAKRAEAVERGEEVGLSTGFRDLDRLIYGLLPAKYYVIGGRPAMCKSILVQQMAEHAAKEGHSVIYASLEMDPEEGLADRSMSRWSGLSQDDLYRGKNLDDVVRLAGENEPWYDNIYFIDDPDLTTARLRGHCRRVATRDSLGLIVVDYLQLLRDGEDVSMDDTPRVSFISRRLNGLKTEFKVPVVAVSNLNRGIDRRSDKRPHLSDLRNSGQIEYDSDVVMLLYRDEVYNENSPKENIVEVDVAKQRGGPVGRVELAFLPEQVKLVDLFHCKGVL